MIFKWLRGSVILDDQLIMEPDYDTVFIGGGPIGLYTAIQTKICYPEKHILIFEQYREYQRKHTLRIDQSVFRSDLNNPKFKIITDSFGNKVSTAEIENKFKEFALELGIHVWNKRIESFDEIINIYPSVRTIVDASGSHSVFRSKFTLDSQQKMSNHLNYLADLKFSTQYDTVSFNLWTEAIPCLTQIHHLISETVSDKNVSLHIFISEDEYRQLQPHTTFKNPIIFNPDVYDKLIPFELHESIKIWLAKRKALFGEQYESPLKLTVTDLAEYYINNVHIKYKNDVDCFIVGDAAFGVPYFRNFANGCLCANVLVKCFDPQSSPSSLKIMSPITAYQNYVWSLQTMEKFKAHGKNLKVKVAIKSIHSSQFAKQSAVSATELMESSYISSGYCAIL
jgi:hypothetical protein